MSISEEIQNMRELLKIIGRIGGHEAMVNVASNPFTPANSLETYYRQFSYTYVPNVPNEKLWQEYEKKEQILVAIAENPETPEKIRRSLASKATLAIIEALLRNPSITEPEVIDLILNKPCFIKKDEIIEAVLSYYAPLTRDIVNTALQHASKELKKKIAKTSASPVILDALEKDEQAFSNIIFNTLAGDDRLARIYYKLCDNGKYDGDYLVGFNKGTPAKILDLMARESNSCRSVCATMKFPAMCLATLEFLENGGRKDKSWSNEYGTYGMMDVSGEAKNAIQTRKIHIKELTDNIKSPDMNLQVKGVKNPIIPPIKLLELARISDSLREEVRNNPNIPHYNQDTLNRGPILDDFSDSHSISIACKGLDLSYTRELLNQPINFRNNLTEEAHEFANQLAIILLQKAKILQRIEEKPEIGDMIKLPDDDFEAILQNAQELRRARIMEIVSSIDGVSDLLPKDLNLDELSKRLKEQIPTISGEIDEMLRTIEVAREIKMDIRLEDFDSIIEQLVKRLTQLEAKRSTEAAALYNELWRNEVLEPGLDFI